MTKQKQKASLKWTETFLGEPKVTNQQIELNISTKSLTIIHSDSREPEKVNRLIARHSIELVSFAAQGSDETNTADMFGYIAKLRNETDRRCHVFRFEDVPRIMHIIDDAIRLATLDMSPPMAPPIQPTSGLVNIDPTFVQEPKRQPLAPSPRTVRNQIPDRPSPEPGGSGLREDPNGLLGLDLRDKPWFHGELNRAGAEYLLHKDGDFLVR
ncbi:phosphotyrosine interaction domain protein [Cooperia oncophora]